MSKSKALRTNWKQLYEDATFERVRALESKNSAEAARDQADRAHLQTVGALNAERLKLARAKRILEANAEHFDTLDKPKMAKAIRADLSEL
jgi:hypothetical protein